MNKSEAKLAPSSEDLRKQTPKKKSEYHLRDYHPCIKLLKQN